MIENTIEHVRKNIVSKKVHRNIAYFTLNWSDMHSCSRDKIYGLVPSLSGIWEIYWLEKSYTPRFLKMGIAWYGGLRNELRFESDASERKNKDFKDYLESGDCYFRYVICEKRNDLYEVYTVLMGIRGVSGNSGQVVSQYDSVRLSEPDTMHIHRVRRSNEPPIQKLKDSSRVPDMFDVVEELRRMQLRNGNTDTNE